MIAQLARLTLPVAKSPGTLAIAVYSDAAGVPITAADRGYEGVACVDDAARALVLLSDLWTETRITAVREWAASLLEFLLYMQHQDGRFANFISDWAGTRNEDGPTSSPDGASFWQARGVHALARASTALGDPRSYSAARRGIAHVRAAPAPANVRAIHILTALSLLRSGRMPELRVDLKAWCGELVACRQDGVLFDDPDQREPHLWAHIQEGALAEAGAYLGRDDLVQVARESAVRYLAPLIESGFDLPTVQPDGVASAIFGVERLAAVTGERRFALLTAQARAWFHKRDRLGRAVYDPAAGKVHDGIDGRVVNSHSGAESNIAGAQAMFPELVRSMHDHGTTVDRLTPGLDRPVALAG